MPEPNNPFLLQGYRGADTFCDRRAELAFLREAMHNERNVTIISLRRLGKSALIRHLFASQRGCIPVFVDLYRTTDQAGMVARIVAESLKQVGKPTRALLKEVVQAIRSLEFGLSFDALTGLPELTVKARAGQRDAVALDELFRYLDARKKPVWFALDEFQQVTHYPERDTEALLREHVQRLSNVRFIFSGSDRRMMQAIFADGKRPFFQAAEPLHLGPIPDKEYAAFIKKHFQAVGKRIDDAVIDQGLAWCRTHTYYVQYLFNRLFALGQRRCDLTDLHHAQEAILAERAPEYITFTRLLTANQVALATAIARTGTVWEPLAMSFIREHKLSAASTVRQSLGVLLHKEVVHETDEGYRLTDVFFGHWLAQA